MRFEFSKSFQRTVKKLDFRLRSDVIDSVSDFCDEFENNIIPVGTGFKYLRGSYYEFRVSVRLRVIFTMRNDLIEFVIVGSHDEVRKFLKNI